MSPCGFPAIAEIPHGNRIPSCDPVHQPPPCPPSPPGFHGTVDRRAADVLELKSNQALLHPGEGSVNLLCFQLEDVSVSPCPLKTNCPLKSSKDSVFLCGVKVGFSGRESEQSCVLSLSHRCYFCAVKRRFASSGSKSQQLSHKLAPRQRKGMSDCAAASAAQHCWEKLKILPFTPRPFVLLSLL